MAIWISQRLFCLFFRHAILLASSTQSSASTSQIDSNLIRQTCRHTNNFNLCVASLVSGPRSSNADVKGLACISLQQVLAKAIQTLQIGKLFNQTSDRLLLEFLGTCIEEYNKAVTRELRMLSLFIQFCFGCYTMGWFWEMKLGISFLSYWLKQNLETR
ncbi:hypothetical protein ACSBR2_031481 [Camellia fascicularis]